MFSSSHVLLPVTLMTEKYYIMCIHTNFTFLQSFPHTWTSWLLHALSVVPVLP